MIGCVSIRMRGFAGGIVAHPGAFAATARFPGGYGIRPYGAGGDACIDLSGVRQTGAWGKALSLTRCGGSPLAEGAKKNTAAHYCSYSTPLSLSYSTVQPSACKRAAVGVSAAVRT